MIRIITHECKKTLGEILKIKLNKMTEITGIKKYFYHVISKLFGI